MSSNNIYISKTHAMLCYVICTDFDYRHYSVYILPDPDVGLTAGMTGQ